MRVCQFSHDRGLQSPLFGQPSLLDHIRTRPDPASILPSFQIVIERFSVKTTGIDLLPFSQQLCKDAEDQTI